MTVVPKGWPGNAGVLAWCWWQTVSHVESVWGYVHLRMWEPGAWKAAFSPSVVWPWPQNLLGSYPTPAKSDSLGIGKINLGVQQIPFVTLMPTAFWRTADPEWDNTGCGSLGSCDFLTSKVPPSKSQNPPLSWGDGRSPTAAVAVTESLSWPWCWACQRRQWAPGDSGQSGDTLGIFSARWWADACKWGVQGIPLTARWEAGGNCTASGGSVMLPVVGLLPQQPLNPVEPTEFPLSGAASCLQVLSQLPPNREKWTYLLSLK